MFLLEMNCIIRNNLLQSATVWWPLLAMKSLPKVPMRHISITPIKDDHRYPRGIFASWVLSMLIGTDDLSHAWLLGMLMGTDDLSHGY